MATDDGNAQAFWLGEWLVEPQLNRLTRDGTEVSLENKTMGVLVLLAARRGDVVSNDEIINAVWAGRPMGENPVYKCITNLRKALGDDPKSPRYIATIARKGYRLIADVSAVDTDDGPQAFSSTPKGPRALAIAIAVSVAFFAVAYVFSWRERPAPATDSKPMGASIAVMPFENLSADPENEYFCRGVAEEILNRLAEIPDLRVVARHSSFVNGSRVDDLPNLMRTLHVRYALSGSVRQQDDMVRVNARLSDAEGTVIWTDSFDRSIGNIFVVQNNIANAVLSGLALEVDESFATDSAPTTSFDAYAAYLLGREYFNRRPAGWVSNALKAFQDAIRLDPQYAAPYAGLAMVNLVRGMNDPSKNVEARDAIDIALRLDPNLAEAHAALGLYEMNAGTTAAYRSAVKSLRRALELNSSLMPAHNWLSTALHVLGEQDEAQRVLAGALAIDPLNSILNGNYATRLHANGDLDAARAQFKRTLELPDAQAYIYGGISGVEISAGNYDTALEWAKKGVVNGVFAEDTRKQHAAELARFYAYLGMFDRANAWLELYAMPKRSHWWLGAQYEVLAPQSRHEELGLKAAEHLATKAPDEELTLWSRSLVGSVALRNGDYGRAIEYLEPLFGEGWSLHNTVGGATELFGVLHHLALAYRATGREGDAIRLLSEGLEKLLKRRERSAGVLSDSLVDEALTHLLLGDEERALTRLREAVGVGWRDYYHASANPCWARLHGNPEFEALMAEVKQDLDVQRERVIAEERLRPFDPPEVDADIL